MLIRDQNAIFGYNKAMTKAAKNDLAAQQEEIASHARVAFGMRSWVADAYAAIATAPEPENHSATATLRACNKLTEDDSGSVDPLSAALAHEVLRLNDTSVALTPNTEATMHTLLDVLGMEHAEPDEKAKLLAALGSYLKNHDFADDGNFRAFAKVVDAASEAGGPSA